MQPVSLSFTAIALSVLLAVPGHAEPWAGTGDLRMRNDLQLLNDSGVINVPLTAWPVAWGDIYRGLELANADALTGGVLIAYRRVMQRINTEMNVRTPVFGVSVGGDGNPRIIRGFENTLRENGEVAANVSFVGRRFALNVRASHANDPADGKKFRPDGTYVGAALGNWMLSAGWQDRWWGPGRDSSLILSTNARPTPGIAVSRILSTRADSKFFRWMGPWTLDSFMTVLDDDRHIENGWLWGLRASFRPVPGLEIGLSRTAQWCGDDRECNVKTFLRGRPVRMNSFRPPRKGRGRFHEKVAGYRNRASEIVLRTGEVNMFGYEICLR